jgi:proteasome lid subunit RPN8/RPN11
MSETSEMSQTRKQIPVDEHASAIQLPGRVLNEICTHALETRPEECCGLVTGVDADRFREVYRCRNTMTLQHQNDPESYPRDGREAYYMSETDYLRALEDAETRGESVTAVYHSHVAAGVYLSEMDQDFANHELFPFPSAAQIVLAVGANAVDRVLGAGIFERDAAGHFKGRPLEVGE